MSYTLSALAEHCGGQVQGDASIRIEAVATLEAAGPSDIASLFDSRHRSALATTRAGAVILAPDRAQDHVGNAIISDNPRLAYAKVAALLYPAPVATPGIDAHASVATDAQLEADVQVAPGAVIESGACIGAGAIIGPGSIVMRGAVIGAGTRLVARVVVAPLCHIGQGCLLHPGVVVGGDGFGFVRDADGWLKIPQIGTVRIGDRVEIGANSTVDRGTIIDTVIEDGVKIDNLVQIGHNVRIGADTVIAAGSGVAGSTTVGKRCTIGGQVGIFDHVTICDDVAIAGKAMVGHSIDTPGVYASSLRAEPIRRWQRHEARFRSLDEMAKKLNKLEQELKIIKEE